jgi:hypothetical protein
VGEDAPSSRHSDHKAALPTPKKNLREEEDGDGFLDLTTVNEGEELILDIDFRAQDNEEEDGAVGQPAVAASSAADPVATSSNGLQHHSPSDKRDPLTRLVIRWTMRLINDGAS